MGLGPFRLTHYSSVKLVTVSNTPLQVPLSKNCYGVVISNNESATHLQVSFDGGANFVDVQDNTTLVLDNIIVGANQLWVQSTKAGHSFNMVTKEG